MALHSLGDYLSRVLFSSRVAWYCDSSYTMCLGVVALHSPGGLVLWLFVTGLIQFPGGLVLLLFIHQNAVCRGSRWFLRWFDVVTLHTPDGYLSWLSFSSRVT